MKGCRKCDSPKKHVDAGLGAFLRGLPLEINKLHASAHLAAPACLPLEDFGPRAFVDGVVDRNDGFHVRGLGVVVLVRHRLEELRLRGVDPVSITGFRDRRSFALLGEGPGGLRAAGEKAPPRRADGVVNGTRVGVGGGGGWLGVVDGTLVGGHGCSAQRATVFLICRTCAD